ncbi:MAG: hypothetical protein B6D64_11855 [Bacteroidetes bacterium 4484_276]|nr:MAG: hypothetical protein B6D64_11855 [Bacteroidetes bacterium 4484_276]OYT12373.1 MAG: hypothetical protein B6I19_09905 [Bacteroidetes bacterium 4572_114]
MKNYKLFVLLLIGSTILWGCGKPTTPDSIEPEDLSGGYKIVAEFHTPGYSQDVIKKDNLLYMAQGEGGLLILDITDPTDPQTVSATVEGVRGYSAKIDMKDSVVYLAAGGFGVTVVDVSDPYEPVVTFSNLPMKPSKSFYIMGDYLFTAISEQGVYIADISYPTQPDPRGKTEAPGYARGISVTNDSALMLVACGEVGLSIFDISEFDDGWGVFPLVSWTDTPGYAESIALVDGASLAFLACGTAGLQIIDYSDTLNVHIVGSYDTPGFARDIIYKDNKVYMAAGLGGFQVLDVSDVANPKLIGIVETEYALGLDIDDDYIYVADEETGLIVISIPK